MGRMCLCIVGNLEIRTPGHLWFFKGCFIEAKNFFQELFLLSPEGLVIKGLTVAREIYLFKDSEIVRVLSSTGRWNCIPKETHLDAFPSASGPEKMSFVSSQLESLLGCSEPETPELSNFGTYFGTASLSPLDLKHAQSVIYFVFSDMVFQFLQRIQVPSTPREPLVHSAGPL